MPLTRKQIIQKELDFFKSDLAMEPAFLTQGYPYSEGKCVYQTPDGRKCAVGALIKPAHYNPQFDADRGTPVGGLSEEVINYLGQENIEWLSKLQKCHDDCAIYWDSEFTTESHFGRSFLREAKAQGLLS